MAKATDRRALLLEGDVGAALRALSIPMAFGIVFIILVDVVDTFYVGQLGTDELAAMSFAFPVIGLVVNVAMGFSVGATSAISRAIGGGDERGVRRLTTHALLLAMAAVALISGLGLLTQASVFRLLGAPERLLPLLERFMTIWYAGAVFLVVPMVGNGVQRATGDTRRPALIMMVAAIANLILDPIFIFGAGPVPAMGLEGAAIATLISRSLTLVITLVILGRMGLLDLHIPPWSELWGSWRRILSVGVPAAVTNMLVPIAAAVMTALIAREGAAAVAGYGIGGRLEGLLLIAPLAVSSSLTPLVGQNWAAQRPQRVQEALRLSQRFVVAWGAGVWLVMALAGGATVSIFTSDPTVTASARTYLWILPLAYGAHGLVSVAGASFNAVDRALTGTVLSALRSLGLAVPLAWLGGALFGLPGVFAGIASATAVSGVIATIWLRGLTRPAPVIAAPTSALLAPASDQTEAAIDALLARVTDLDDITVCARAVSTLGFYVGDQELGHVHPSGLLDLHLPPRIHDQLLTEGLTDHHRSVHDASWVTFALRGLADVDRAAWLLGLGQVMLRLRRGHPQAEADLTRLGPSDELRRRILAVVAAMPAPSPTSPAGA